MTMNSGSAVNVKTFIHPMIEKPLYIQRLLSINNRGYCLTGNQEKAVLAEGSNPSAPTISYIYMIMEL